MAATDASTSTTRRLLTASHFPIDHEGSAARNTLAA
jgi:hypothetical protein